MTNQQLKAHCEDVIANPQDHLDWVVDMARVALASLEAVPVAYADAKAIMRMLDGGTRFFTAFPGTSKTKSIPVFIDVPVPELKPIELPKETGQIGNDFWLGEMNMRSAFIQSIRAAGYEVKSL
ncbi:hypothetical protein [Pantoea sp. S18]|uniref:hypothetical protein n=1 Tax=Pantoea sp. S18 TaxID=3019892 RepID=UPI002B20F328|nr:hypothetical protein [Pantoea sp. S18]MEA5104735.1 hypothetical protein [Pantoea sp. S18]